MSFAIQTQTISGNGSGPPFKFPSEIGTYVYGIQQMNIQLNANTKFQQIGIALTPQDNSGDGYTQVVLNQEFLGDNVDLGKSWTQVSVLAWLGAPDPEAGIYMAYRSGIPVGGTSSALSLAGTPTVAVATLAGFSYQFQGDDSPFLGIGASCGVVQDLFSSQAVNAVVQGTLTGESAFSGTVDAGLFVLTGQQPAQPVLAVDVITNGTVDATNYQTVGPYLDGAPLSAAALFIQSFFAQFPILPNQPGELYQLQMGAPSGGIRLNNGGVNGMITFEGTQQLVTLVNGFADDNPANLITNYVLVAL